LVKSRNKINADWDIEGPEGIRFFGRVCASISHELKNALAIVNENAGLLEDFVLMAEKGMDINPDQMSTIAGRISSQISRADRITGNLNSFAHSVDDQICDVDLSAVIQLTIAVTSRIVAMNGMTVQLKQPEDDVRLFTSPFLLEHLISSVLFRISEMIVDDDEIVIQPGSSGQGAVLHLSAGSGKLPVSEADFRDNALIKTMLQALHSTIEVESESQSVIIQMEAMPSH
jgi:hypothetical protein